MQNKTQMADLGWALLLICGGIGGGLIVSTSCQGAGDPADESLLASARDMAETESSDGAADQKRPVDGSSPPAVSFCVPIRPALAKDYAHEREQYRDALIETAKTFNQTPGTVSRSYTSDGKISRLSFDAPGTGSDFTQYFSWDSDGRLTRWEQNHDDPQKDVTEYYSYDAGGHLVRWESNATGSSNDVTEYFSWSTSGLIARAEVNKDGAANDVTYYYSYSAEGRITRMEVNADGSTNDATEYFSYDSDGRLTRYEKNADGSANDVTVYVSYDSMGNISRVSTTGPAGMVVISNCK